MDTGGWISPCWSVYIKHSQHLCWPLHPEATKCPHFKQDRESPNRCIPHILPSTGSTSFVLVLFLFFFFFFNQMQRCSIYPPSENGKIMELLHTHLDMAAHLHWQPLQPWESFLSLIQVNKKQKQCKMNELI